MTVPPEYVDPIGFLMPRDPGWTPTQLLFDVRGSWSIWDSIVLERGSCVEVGTLPIVAAALGSFVTPSLPTGVESLTATTVHHHLWNATIPVSASTSILRAFGLEVLSATEYEESAPPQASPQAVSTAWLDRIHRVTSIESSDLASWYASMDED